MSDSADRVVQTVPGYLTRVHGEGAALIADDLERFAARPGRAAFFRLFALAPRRIPRVAAAPSPAEAEALRGAHGNLGRGGWTDDQLARLWILCAVQEQWPPERFAAELDTLFNTADTGELVALYRSVPVLREPRRFLARMGEGARTNIVPVFRAVAHDNGYAAEFFEQDAWNQLILKAIFLACPLDPVVGLDRRANAPLAHMLSDYVRERWAAGRSVPWDIWRCIGPRATEPEDLRLLHRALQSDERMTRLAAALALRERAAAGNGTPPEPEAAASELPDDMNWQGLAALDDRG